MDDRTVKPRPLPGSRRGQDHRGACRLARGLGLVLAVVLLLLLTRLASRDHGGEDWAPGRLHRLGARVPHDRGAGLRVDPADLALRVEQPQLPFGPMMACTSPAFTCNVIPRRISLSPILAHKLLIESI